MTAVRSNALVIILAIAAMLTAGCQTMTVTEKVEDTPVINAQVELEEQQLLDVGIRVFDPGEISEKDREKKGLTTEIRSAEARFIPLVLRDTLQRTGHWGAVRVVPAQTHTVDVLVEGKILESDGEVLELEVKVSDASGRRWFSTVYEKQVDAQAYLDADESEIFQDVYNRIANDLYRHKAKLSAERVLEIQRIAQLRFGESLAPQAFDGFVTSTDDGQYRIQRLPAEDDSMLDRVMKVREREHMLIDVVNGYYDKLNAEMAGPYFDWRKARSDEAAALREVKQKAANRYLLGAAMIVGAIAIEALGGSSGTDTVRDVMVLGGAYNVKRGMDISAQKAIHEDAIRELGESFNAEVAPLVLNVEGQTVELTGSAEQQFHQWRRLLSEIYATETGAPTPDIADDDQPPSSPVK
jgi:hypothetical protein